MRLEVQDDDRPQVGQAGSPSRSARDPLHDKIVAAHRSGLSVQEIAERSRCTPMLIHKILGDAGLIPPRRGRPYPYDSQTEEVIAAAYAGGATMRDLVRLHGGNNRSLTHILQHRSVPRRPQGRRRKAPLPT